MNSLSSIFMLSVFFFFHNNFHPVWPVWNTASTSVSVFPKLLLPVSFFVTSFPTCSVLVSVLFSSVLWSKNYQPFLISDCLCSAVYLWCYMIIAFLESTCNCQFMYSQHWMLWLWFSVICRHVILLPQSMLEYFEVSILVAVNEYMFM